MRAGTWSGILAAMILLVGGSLVEIWPATAGPPANPKPAPIEGSVRLPPFFVEASRIADWQYAAVPGYEVLSACSPKVTTSFIVAFYRQLSVLHEIAPA